MYVVQGYTFAHRLTLIPVGITGVNTLHDPRPLLHNKSRRAGEGYRGADRKRDVTAAKIPMRDIRFITVLAIKSCGVATATDKMI